MLVLGGQKSRLRRSRGERPQASTVVVKGVASRPLSNTFEQLVGERIGDTSLYQHSAGGGATLPGGLKSCCGDLVGCVVQISVVENERRVLATQFECQQLSGLRHSRLSNAHADRPRARKADGVYALVSCERGAGCTTALQQRQGACPFCGDGLPQLDIGLPARRRDLGGL